MGSQDAVGDKVRWFILYRKRERERTRENDVPHGGSKNSMPRLNNPSSTASSVRSLRRGRYTPRKGEARGGERREEKSRSPENPQGCDRGRTRRAFHNVSSHRWTRSTGVTSTPLRERISSALPFLKRPPANREGDPHAIRRISRFSSTTCHVRQWRSSGLKNFAFRTNRRRAGIATISRVSSYVGRSSWRPWKITGTCGLLPVF